VSESVEGDEGVTSREGEREGGREGGKEGSKTEEGFVRGG